MRISDSHRFAFVHIQKTGGVTIERVIDGLVPGIRWFKGGQRHLTLEQILKKEPGVADYWVFGFVRNPWARMLSWWSMIQDTKERAERGDEAPRRMFARHDFMRDMLRYPDFDTFLERGPEEHNRLRRPQIEYLTAGDRRADFIGRTESLDPDLRTVLAKFGLPAPPEVPRVNKSPTGGDTYRVHYTAAGRDRVAEIFKPDIDEFGYEY